MCVSYLKAKPESIVGSYRFGINIAILDVGRQVAGFFRYLTVFFELYTGCFDITGQGQMMKLKFVKTLL